jgi:Rhodopirellula transposase DDE domain
MRRSRSRRCGVGGSRSAGPPIPKPPGCWVCADAGGSNGYRVGAWKTELARLATETGLAITVCHLPPGTSRWNRSEHRLFSAISMNWRGRPLTGHEVLVELIGATTTQTGLRVRAELDRGRDPLGVRVGDEELAAVPLARHAVHGEWNYTLQPAADKPPPTARSSSTTLEAQR